MAMTDSGFYCDNALRGADGALTLSGERTETCQYYAFYMGVATIEEDTELWRTMVEEFGPARRENNRYPSVHFSNSFIGNYLRIELLYQDHQYEAVIDNIKGYFAKMAEQTKTLWEHDAPTASCNHGFASHVIYWLAGIYKTCRCNPFSEGDKEYEKKQL